MAVIARRGSVHEMQDAVTSTQRKADVRGGIKSGSVARNDSDDVAAAQFRFNACDFVLRNFIQRSRGDIRFHARERSEQGAVRGEITVMSPASAHLARGMWDTASA